MIICVGVVGNYYEEYRGGQVSRGALIKAADTLFLHLHSTIHELGWHFGVVLNFSFEASERGKGRFRFWVLLI